MPSSIGNKVKRTNMSIISILKKATLSLLVALLLSGCGHQVKEQTIIKTADMQWWQDARFGVFMCWGPCTLANAEIGWGRAGERPGQGFADRGVPAEEYNNLYKQFDPVNFDAKQWVKMMKDAGAGYFIFLTKHHDGFCMFDSKLTDYDIMSTPFGRDVTKELTDACHEADLPIFFYYSQPDWIHEDYLTENHDNYIKYLHGQIRELLTNYGKIDGMWFDGLGRNGKDWMADSLENLVRTLQPGIIINSRLAKEKDGDFITPENHIGPFNNDTPWETCQTMHNGWSYHENPKIKTLDECLEILVKCAGGGGNLALNVGPRADGSIHPEMIENYQQIGEWLQTYGTTIRGTIGGPWVFPISSPLAATRNDKHIYLHILDTLLLKQLELPAINANIIAAKVLTGGTIKYDESEKGLVLNINTTSKAINTVIEFTIEESTLDIEPVSVIDYATLAVSKITSSKTDQTGYYVVENCVDNDLRTFWQGEWGKPTTIELNLEQIENVNRIKIYGHGIKNYELQYKDGNGEYQTINNEIVFHDLDIHVDNIKTDQLRLVIKKSSRPAIYEFQVFKE